MPLEAPAAADLVRPFENLPALPRDLAEAFEALQGGDPQSQALGVARSDRRGRVHRA